jgi:hypothetical protein
MIAIFDLLLLNPVVEITVKNEEEEVDFDSKVKYNGMVQCSDQHIVHNGCK